MKLKKFTKNKKLKNIFIGSIVGIMLLVGGISLYRTFALYKEEKTFDVLNGTIPDFVYKEDILKGAYPVLKSKTGEKLIPVIIDEDNGTVRKADIKDKWYSYEEKKWANAVLLVDGVDEPKNDEEIPEENIESYFVWIPKYKYKIFDMGNTYTSIEKESYKDKGPVTAIKIEFGLEDTKDDENKQECKTPGVSGENGTCAIGKWMTHPAFTAFPGSHGMWVGKFETGYKGADTAVAAQQNNSDITNVVIKPDQFSWRSITINNSYTVSLNYEPNLQSHNMKNTEWGAVAYLTQSFYGRCSNTTNDIVCNEVTINGNANYKTGYSNSYASYLNIESTKSSTTGNYTGIYDMSGGNWEQQISVMVDENNQKIYGSSGLTDEILNDNRYYDVYKSLSNNLDSTKRILGDATGEMGPFYTVNSQKVNSYYNDHAYFISSSGSWIYRGGYYARGVNAGIFAFHQYIGDEKGTAIHGFRIVLTPQ